VPWRTDAALTDPDSLLTNLEGMAYEAAGPAALRYAVAKLRPRLEPALKKQRLAWADVEPILHEVDSTAKLEAAADNPIAFLDQLAQDCAVPLAVRIAVVRMRPKAEPPLKKRGLAWDDVAPIFTLIDSLDKIEAAVRAAGFCGAPPPACVTPLTPH
jgi:hypothetical protein